MLAIVFHHRSNYADITWWEMLFGTDQNPARFDATCGFDDARNQQLGAMLRWQDVHDSPRKRSTIE